MVIILSQSRGVGRRIRAWMTSETPIFTGPAEIDKLERAAVGDSAKAEIANYGSLMIDAIFLPR